MRRRHLLRELALAVGPEGEAVGIDPSEDQINAAKTLCEDLDNVTLVAGSATQTDFESESFGSVASIQVLEYIADVESTFKRSAAGFETWRALRHSVGFMGSLAIPWP